MDWVKLVFLFLLFDLTLASERTCAQCVAGKYLSQRSLMQDSVVGQSMGWVLEWKGTDCTRGNIRFIPCLHACIKVTLVRFGAEDNAVEGIMMDCSDDMIHSSPDLPQGIDFKEYDENAIFSNKRRNFTITYAFTMDSVDNKENIQEQHSGIVMPSYKADTQTNSIVIPLFGVVLGIGLCCCLCISSCIHERGRKRRAIERNKLFLSVPTFEHTANGKSEKHELKVQFEIEPSAPKKEPTEV